MFNRLAPRPSFESDRSTTSLKDKLRALVLPKQTDNTSQFNLLNDVQSVHSDTWSISSSTSRQGLSPVGWAGSSHAYSIPPHTPGTGWPSGASHSASRLSPLPMVSTPRPKFYTQSSSSSAKSTHSLRLDPRYHASGSASYIDDPYLAKQLSPIAEQDHFSPEGRILPLPSSNDRDATITTTQLYNSSPDGSEIARPSPVFSTFLTRPLNRSLSQNSSHTHISIASAPPSFPSETRSFTGASGSMSTSRPPVSSFVIRPMPTIPGSTEGHHGNVFDDNESAKSFVTASSLPGLPVDITEEARRSHYSLNIEPATFHYADEATEAGIGRQASTTSRARTTRTTSTMSESLARNWRRSGQYCGNAMASFPKLREPRFHKSITPACWMFWLGFIAPWCWILGGWYFTIRGETRPTSRTVPKKKLPLPSWIMEKKVTGGAELSEKEAALNGIWFGYPYVAPSVNSLPLHSDVRTKQTPTPSVLDPWIFRCRVAAWTGAGLLIIAFVTAFIVVGKKYS